MKPQEANVLTYNKQATKQPSSSSSSSSASEEVVLASRVSLWKHRPHKLGEYVPIRNVWQVVPISIQS